MFACSNTKCSAQSAYPANFCNKCGASMVLRPQAEVLPPIGTGGSDTSKSPNPHQAVAHGFGGVFGLHPGVAFFVIAANLMLFGGDGLLGLIVVGTGGIGAVPALLLSVAAGAAVGYVAYLGQMKFAGDDHESAKIRGMITGILTAIPTRLPGVLFGAFALLGMLRRKR